MAMTVAIQEGTGSSPTWADVTTVTFGGSDAATSSTAVATPASTGTNFSFVKSFSPNISDADSLSMTDVLFGKVAAEAVTGTKLWQSVAHSSYTQATAAPTATSDNNSTAPTINSATATAVSLISAPPTAYADGPFSTTGRHGNIVEVVVGVDSTNTSAGSQSIATLRWSWTES